jgi:hypothetical protein
MPLTGSNWANRLAAALFDTGTSLSVFCEVADFDSVTRSRTPNLNSALKDFTPANQR